MTEVLDAFAFLEHVEREETRVLGEAGRTDFKTFIRQSWPVLEPATPLLWNWHIDCIAEHLTAVFLGQITRLVVNIAPGTMKSTIFSVMWPAWCWIQRPDIRWLCASHSLDLAIRDNRNCRTLIESPWYQACYGDNFHMAGDQNAKSFFENDKRGYRLAVSVGSKGIGKRGTFLLIDDPNDARASQADIEATKHWFGQTWLGRLNDQEHGSMVIVGQRLHQEDLSGYVLEHLRGWESVVLPTEYEALRRFHTSIGEDRRTVEGELLWPARFPSHVLTTLKIGLGSIGYAAQHQQAPVPASGGTFKKEWVRYFSIENDYYVLHTKYGRSKSVAINTCELRAVADLAISEKEESDFFVLQTWAITPDGNEALLLHQYRGHLSNPEQQKQVVELYERFLWTSLDVESVAYQLALIQQLKNYAKEEEVEPGLYRKRMINIPVREFHPVRDKVSRASVAAIKMEAGDMYWLVGASYLPDLEPEVFKFPKSTKKDQVDCLSMICDILSNPNIPLSGDETTPALPAPPTLEEIARIDPFAWSQEHSGEE